MPAPQMLRSPQNDLLVHSKQRPQAVMLSCIGKRCGVTGDLSGISGDILSNLQLLTDSENLSKNATPFDHWIQTRDAAFRKRHLIPDLPTYGFDSFEEFSKARTDLIVGALKELQ